MIKWTSLNWKPRRANHATIPSSAPTAKVIIRQTQMYAHSGDIDSIETSTIESNKNFVKAGID